MALLVTISGDASNYLIRGVIWEVGPSSYRARVDLVPAASRADLSQSPISVVSAGGLTLQGALDQAVARVMTAVDAPVQNLEVRAAPHHAEAAVQPQ